MARKKTEELIIRVRGRSMFPIDMLRYDRGTPNGEIDSAKIVDAINAAPELREIDVRVTANSAPTAGRWNSFGWTVTHAWDGAQWVPYVEGVHQVRK